MIFFNKSGIINVFFCKILCQSNIEQCYKNLKNRHNSRPKLEVQAVLTLSGSNISLYSN